MPLADLKRMVETATSLTEEARSESERARDYYDGKQLTDDELAEMARRRQPPLVFNRIRKKIDGMSGIEQRGRTDPRAYPRAPGDEGAAEVATKSLTFVEEVERLDVKRTAAFENVLVEGYGGVEVGAEMRAGQVEVTIRRVRWEDIIYDPYSREKDFSDATYIGVVKWMTVDRARAWLGALAADEDSLTGALDLSDSYADRPRDGLTGWMDKRQKRVRVAQLYHLEGGVWQMSVFTGRGVLREGPSPYLGWDGEPCCPILLMSAYVDRDNNRHGIVRDMIPPQDEINKRRSKALHILNSNQTVALEGAFASVDAFKREKAKPDGHIEISIDAAEMARDAGMKPFEVIPQAFEMQGQLALLQEAQAEIDMFGPSASMLGQLGASASGRAIMAQQQAGYAEIAPIMDVLRDWTTRVYRQVWAAIRQFWTEPRYIRVTEDGQAPRLLGINQVVMGPNGLPQVMNRVAEIDVDIIVDQAPEYATLEAEQFDTLAGLAKAGLPVPPIAIVQASNLRNKQDIIKAMQQAMQPPPPPPQMQQLQLRGAEADVEGKEAKAARDRAAAAKDLASVPLLRAEAMGEMADAQTGMAQAAEQRARATFAGAQALSAQAIAQAQAVMARRASGF
jgi:hypothetical protein